MIKLTAMLLLVLLTSGCALGPHYKRPTVDLPDPYRGGMQQAAQSSAKLLGNQKWDPNQSSREATRDSLAARTVDGVQSGQTY